MALLVRPQPRALRRGIALGTSLAIGAAGAAAAFGLAAGPATRPPDCAALPRSEGNAALHAAAFVDGAETGRLAGEPTAPAALTAVLAGLENVPIEDHGVERWSGIAARRCSVLVDGDTGLAAMPPLTGLLGRAGAGTGLPIWRGELEWWVSEQGQLVGARLAVGGHPADAWPSRGLRGRLTGELDLVRGAQP